MEILKDIAVLVFPALFSALLGKLVKERANAEKLKRIIAIAEEAVLFAEDAFPQSPGVEKLKKAIEYLKGALAKGGIKLSDAEAEAKVRAAYQRLQQKAIQGVLDTLFAMREEQHG